MACILPSALRLWNAGEGEESLCFDSLILFRSDTILL